MRCKPAISVAMTTGLVEMITSKGGDADQILRGCGLAPSALTKPDGFIATAQMAMGN